MSSRQIFEQSISIKSSATIVEQCLTDLEIMHCRLNPIFKCKPVRKRSTEIGEKSRFIIKIPFFNPTLSSEVLEREPGLIVWKFEGFFRGRDHWECQPIATGTKLINRFEFEIPNPLVAWGFSKFATTWTKQDIREQLRRLKKVAEKNYQLQDT